MSPEEFEQIKLELINEAKLFAKLTKDFKYKPFHQLDNEVLFFIVIDLQVYIISKAWLRQWKTYVQYKKVKRNFGVNYTIEGI